MHQPRFSVVIPTREGGETLPYTLRTCLVQAHPDYEIVVADNASGPAVRAAVDGCDDERVHYHRSNTLLAMTDSWEFAVSKATGEYVIVLGDDDGLLPHALAEIERILSLTNARALRFECGYYFWPGVRDVPGWEACDLAIPIHQAACGHAVHHFQSEPLIQDAANSRIAYTNLPLIYCGAIHRDLIAEAKQRTGRVFHSRYPDVYSAFAFAALAGTYYSADAPMCLRGTARKSTGLAYFLARDSAVAEEFHALNRAGHYERSPGIPDVPLLPAVVADGFEHARQRLVPEAPAHGRKLLMRNCLQSLDREAAAVQQQAHALLRASLADAADLLAWFDAEAAIRPEVPTSGAIQPDGWLHLDSTAHGITDIARATQFCEQLLRFTPHGCRSWLADPVPRTAWLDPGLPGLFREVTAALTAGNAETKRLTSEMALAGRSVWRRALGACWRWLARRGTPARDVV